jgi:hypothetical protein
MAYSYVSNSNLRGAQRGAALSTATSSFVGVVRVDGSSMLVDANGTISVDPTALNTLSSFTVTNIANLSSTTATNIANLSSVTTSSIAYLSSVAATKATTSTFGIVRANNTSITVNNGTLSLGSSITAAWTIQQVGNGLVFYYGGTPVVQFSSTGAITTISDITGFGTVSG